MSENLTLISHLLDQHKYQKAIPLIKEELKTNPDDQTLRFWLATSYYFTDRDFDAKRLLGELIAESPSDVEFLFLSFRMHMHANEFVEAERQILELIRLRPEAADFYALYSLVMINTFNLEKAKALVAEAARLRPELSPAIKLSQCMIQVVEGKTKGAKQTIGELLAEEPNDSVYLSQLARVLLNRREHKAALVIYESLIRFNPNSEHYRTMVIELRMISHWTALPLWPLYRFGNKASIGIWLGFVVLLLFGSQFLGSYLSYVTFGYLGWVAYGWLHAPVMRKVLS